MSGSALWLALGWTMLHSLWIGGAVCAVAALARFALRRARSEWRYGVACAALFTIAIVPLFLISFAPGSALPAAAAGGSSIAAALPSPAWTQAWIEHLPWLWAIGTPLYTVWLLHGLIGTRRLWHRARCAPERGELSRRCAQLAQQLGVARRVAVRVCDEVAGPLLVGVFKPLIVLPTAVVNGCTPEQIEMVLLHELAHVRRWDNLVQIAQRSVQAALFFHPAVWLVSHWIDLEREHCCDEVVLAHTRRPRAYAETLLALADARGATPALSLSMARKPLTARIQRILQPQEPTGMQGRTLSLVISATLGVASIGLVPLRAGAQDRAPERIDRQGRWVEQIAFEDAHGGLAVGTDCAACHVANAPTCPVPPMAHPHDGVLSDASCTDCHVVGSLQAPASRSTRLDELRQRERELKRLEGEIERLRHELATLRASSRRTQGAQPPVQGRRSQSNLWTTHKPQAGQAPLPEGPYYLRWESGGQLSAPPSTDAQSPSLPGGIYRLHWTPGQSPPQGDAHTPPPTWGVPIQGGSAPWEIRPGQRDESAAPGQLQPPAAGQWLFTRHPSAGNSTHLENSEGQAPRGSLYYRTHTDGSKQVQPPLGGQLWPTSIDSQGLWTVKEEAGGGRSAPTPTTLPLLRDLFVEKTMDDEAQAERDAQSVPILSSLPTIGDLFVTREAVAGPEAECKHAGDGPLLSVPVLDSLFTEAAAGTTEKVAEPRRQPLLR